MSNRWVWPNAADQIDVTDMRRGDNINQIKVSFHTFASLFSLYIPTATHLTTMATKFSLTGKGLKLDTRADIEPYLKDVDPSLVEEIHLEGNTVGIEAAEALGEFIAKATNIKVCPCELFVVSTLPMTRPSSP